MNLKIASIFFETWDLSGALLFLASDANTYTQGTIIVCDGGLIMESF